MSTILTDFKYSDKIIMPTQSTNYTCGPATLFGYSSLAGLNLNLTEMELAKELNCMPEEGTQLIDLAQYSIKHLNAESYGEKTWNGQQMMVAIITDRFEENVSCTHAVLVLGKDIFENIVWWCTIHGQIFRCPLHEFNWESIDGKYNQWSINFPKRINPFEVNQIAALMGPSLNDKLIKF